MGRNNLSGLWEEEGQQNHRGREISFHMPGNCPSMPGLFRKILWSTRCVQSLTSWLCFQTVHMLEVSLQCLLHKVSGHCSSICQSHSFCRHSSKETFWHPLHFSESWQQFHPSTFLFCQVHVFWEHIWYEQHCLSCGSLCSEVEKKADCCWFLGVGRLALTVQHLGGMCLWNTLSSELSLKIKYVKS